LGSIYFTADNHWYHSNILKYCNRPFDNVEQMNKTMIENWNSVVKPNDTVYHLGDFCWAKKVETVDALIKRLNGKIHLIIGNHDKKVVIKSDKFNSISERLEIKHSGMRIILDHYALRVWNASHYGSYQLFGHSHGGLKEYDNILQCDVGVDCWNFTPVSYEQIKEVMDKKDFIPINLRK